MRTFLSTLIAAGWLAAPLALAVNAKPQPTAAPPTWSEFWTLRGVSPPPPRDFLDGPFNGKIQNLTGGKLDDATVRKWVLADIRRGKGDQWGGYNMRLDVINAGVLGPRGLNGTDKYVEGEIANGVHHIEDLGAVEVAAVAVVTVPDALRTNNPELGLTDYAIVLLYRATGKPVTRVFRDGRRELIESRVKPGATWRQIDMGAFFDDPTVGPLWYQRHGWSCTPEEHSPLAPLCGLVKP